MASERILIDAFNLALPHGTGIASYARGLVPTIRHLGFEPQLLLGPAQAPTGDPLLDEVALFDAPREGRNLPPGSASVTGRIRRWLRRSRPTTTASASAVAISGEVAPPPSLPADVARAWAARDVFHAANRGFAATGAMTSLSFEAAPAEAPGLVHWTCPLPLRAPGRPNVYTVHDLVPLRLPWTTLDNKAAFRALVARICADADHILAVSEATRADLVRLFGADPARITATWQSVDIPAAVAEHTEPEVAAEIEGAFGLPWRGYFLFLGAREPKKNLPRALEAYLAAGLAEPLVIVGGAGWLEEGHKPLLGIAPARVRQYDFLPRSLVLSLLRGARALVFPSLWEGFGLPAAEAMALGTPVIASTAGALPEVCGEAALLVDPCDVGAIKRAIQALAADESLRAELARKGLARAAEFSLERSAARLGPVYKALL
ncbi:MAG TPA: glycosyltransferase family 1 protein [Caulobacteraceae bacterium]|nr:glycosyltransferase family 1 protein [Caulobacteraceae bacterium]